MNTIVVKISFSLMNSLKFFLLLSILFTPLFSYGYNKEYKGLLYFDSCNSQDHHPVYKAYESLSLELIYSFIKKIQEKQEDNSVEDMTEVLSRVFIDGEETGWFEMPPIRKKYENDMTIKSPYIAFRGHVSSSIRDQFVKINIDRKDIKISRSEIVETDLNLFFGYSRIIGVYGEFEKAGLEKIQFSAHYPVSLKCVVVTGITIKFEEK